MTSKKLTSKSGITIPKDLRVMLGWEPGMSVDLEADGNGALMIRPHIDRCRLRMCASTRMCVSALPAQSR